MSVAGRIQDMGQRFEWLRFPVKWITTSPNLSGKLAKAILVLAPLQYYVLTFYPGGFQSDDFISAMVVQLFLLLILFAISSALGVISFLFDTAPTSAKVPYRERTRAWAVALFTCWGLTVLLLAVSHSIGRSLTGSSYDLLGQIVCSGRCPGGYPKFDLTTYFVFFCYSILAVIVARVLATAFTKPQSGLRHGQHLEDEMSTRDPNLFVVTLVNAAVITVVFAVTTY